MRNGKMVGWEEIGKWMDWKRLGKGKDGEMVRC